MFSCAVENLPRQDPTAFPSPVWLQLIKVQTLKPCLHRWSQRDRLCCFLTLKHGQVRADLGSKATHLHQRNVIFILIYLYSQQHLLPSVHRYI